MGWAVTSAALAAVALVLAVVWGGLWSVDFGIFAAGATLAAAASAIGRAAR